MLDTISIIGTGRLGLCFGLSAERVGYKVLGVDIDADYVNQINSKSLVSIEPNVKLLLKNSKNFQATTSLEEGIRFSDLLFCFVPTNTLPGGHYDHSIIDKIVNKLLETKTNNKHLVICSTVIPGYTDRVSKKLNKKFSVTYNPEFIAQGSILKDQENPDIVLIGGDNNSPWEKLRIFYKRMCSNDPPICEMSRIEAEICKLSINCFLVTKIAYTNMIGDIVKRSGGNEENVLSAIRNDKRICPPLTKYGYGPGGVCLPRDARALATYAEKIGCSADIPLASDKCSKKHLDFQISEFEKQHPRCSEITINQVTYKPGVDIIEESQQLEFAVRLAKLGYIVTIKESLNVIKKVKELYGELFIYQEKNNG